MFEEFLKVKYKKVGVRLLDGNKITLELVVNEY